MLTVAQARDRILSAIHRLESEQVPLEQAHGRVLAEEVRADRPVPPFANSAMDGYAIVAADIASASAEHPVSLPVAGEVRAGQAAERELKAGTAIRIMTGAMLPRGTDAVIRVEDTRERDGRVEVLASVPSGMSVRKAGSDLKPGDLLAESGRTLTPGLVGVLASVGRSLVRCYRRPRVLVLSTGDELRGVGDKLKPGEIVNTNRYTLSAAVEEAGAEVVDAGVARDALDELVRGVGQATSVDLIVSTGGVSMGKYDLVRNLLEQNKGIDFWQVALRPGKPLAFGIYEGRPFIGLPGNPVSALVCFELFVRPALRAMQGLPPGPRLQAAITDEELDSPPHLEQYFRTIARRDDQGVIHVRLTGDQGSHVLRSMADANSLTRVPQGAGRVAAGTSVEIIELSPIS